MTKIILHLMGATCSGKTTIINKLLSLSDEVAAIQVGKVLREKYGEDYFKGQAAPAHTADETEQIYKHGLAKAVKAGKKLIVIDGQPRDERQVAMCLDTCSQYSGEYQLSFTVVHASHAVREERARSGRKPGPDLDLALARLNNDYKNFYDAVIPLLHNMVPIGLVTTLNNFDLQGWTQGLITHVGATPNLFLTRTPEGTGGIIKITGHNKDQVIALAEEERAKIDPMRSPHTKIFREEGTDNHVAQIKFYGLD